MYVTNNMAGQDENHPTLQNLAYTTVYPPRSRKAANENKNNKS